MAVKQTDETVSPACRVCGGEVNPHGECVVCGTKQSDPPKSPDAAVASWPKGGSDAGSAAWLATPSGDARDEALRKWLGGGGPPRPGGDCARGGRRGGGELRTPPVRVLPRAGAAGEREGGRADRAPG